MRDIKFRAWHKDNRRMLDSIDLDGANFRFNNDWSESINWSVWDRFKSEVIVNEETAILMQYTGLKDMNGTEIYEGDVVSYVAATSGNFSREEGISVVEYKATQYLAAHTAFRPFNLSNGREIKTNSIEVLGNIYESPELLSQKE